MELVEALFTCWSVVVFYQGSWCEQDKLSSQLTRSTKLNPIERLSSNETTHIVAARKVDLGSWNHHLAHVFMRMMMRSIVICVCESMRFNVTVCQSDCRLL